MVDLADFGITSQSIALNCDSFDDYVKAYNPDLVRVVIIQYPNKFIFAPQLVTVRIKNGFNGNINS